MKLKMRSLVGSDVVSVDGRRYHLTGIVGYGSQGMVYEEGTGKYVVKFYFPGHPHNVEENVFERLGFLKNIAMPKNFVTVIDVIRSPYLGYVMERVVDHKPLSTYLIPDPNSSFAEWYNQGLGLYERLFVGYLIARSFGELESNNLSYCDISGNNILVKVAKGVSVKMIDVDNIYIGGKGMAMVLGTPRYIAPEVTSRRQNPDVLSDNYSLAVLLFELLRVGHPYIDDDVLDGTPQDEEAALACKADYVSDENAKNMLPEDVAFTSRLKELFRRCFVEGKTNRMRRPSAVEFEQALLEATNKVIKCPSCGAWHYPIYRNKVWEACPWCENPSNPTAIVNFHDVFCEEEDYRNAILRGKIKFSKHVNSCIIKDRWKNRIRSLYVFPVNEFDKGKSSENYFTIAHDDRGYHAYNEFSKPGIVVRKRGSVEFQYLSKEEPVLLHDGDAVYFEMDNSSAIEMDCGSKTYYVIRVASFWEVSG